ncbi:AI-2E family transporter [Actinomycetaceae bacterium MB13-C1-2]|nr:AI-2E family transporter [Actinomycetaceae bacterium MB13-C1-2]
MNDAGTESLGPDNLEAPDRVGSVDGVAPSRRPRGSSHRRNRATADAEVTYPFRVAAAWSWRFVVVVGAIALCGYLLSYVSMLVVAVLVAILFAALLAPLVTFLRAKWHMGRTGAAAVGLITGLVIVVLLLTVAVTQVLEQLPLIVEQSISGVTSLLDWVANGPWAEESEALREWVSDLQGSISTLLSRYGTVIASGALSVASTTASLATGTVIMLFTLFFIMRDGRAMWVVGIRSLPRSWRTSADEAGIRAWITLGEYVRTQAKVAAIDAVGIGLGAVLLGVPLAVPIMVLVFLFSFIPIVGAFVSGAIAVLIALVNNGLNAGIIMLLVVLLVQQLESNVLQPWLMANAVSLHPVAVVLAVTAGGTVGGIAGAVFAVPVLAVVNVVMLYLHGHDPYPGLADNPDRPGGPPGSLDEQILNSYHVSGKGGKDSTKVASKVRAKAQARAEEKGHVLASPGSFTTDAEAEQSQIDVSWDVQDADED